MRRIDKAKGFLQVTHLLAELYAAKKVQFQLEARTNVVTFDSVGEHKHPGVSFWIEMEVLATGETYKWGIWMGDKDDIAAIPKIVAILEGLKESEVQ